MNNFNFLKIIRVALVVFALTLSTNMDAFNRPINGNKGHNGNNGNKPSHDAVPLDGGLGFLLLGAAAFGVKKLRENKNE